LAGFLLLQSKNPSLNGLGISRTAIAARLATTPETVSRALRELEDKGAIRFDRHRIVILAPDLLQAISLQ
jgi:CRP-like cAMP-binding protein